jgi:hypothetical protein
MQHVLRQDNCGQAGSFLLSVSCATIMRRAKDFWESRMKEMPRDSLMKLKFSKEKQGCILVAHCFSLFCFIITLFFLLWVTFFLMWRGISIGIPPCPLAMWLTCNSIQLINSHPLDELQNDWFCVNLVKPDRDTWRGHPFKSVWFIWKHPELSWFLIFLNLFSFCNEFLLLLKLFGVIFFFWKNKAWLEY